MMIQIKAADEICKAKVAIETALKPYLQTPTLERFLLVTDLWVSARRVIACFASQP
jgi:hypothetical protein